MLFVYTGCSPRETITGTGVSHSWGFTISDSQPFHPVNQKSVQTKQNRHHHIPRITFQISFHPGIGWFHPNQPPNLLHPSTRFQTAGHLEVDISAQA